MAISSFPDKLGVDDIGTSILAQRVLMQYSRPNKILREIDNLVGIPLSFPWHEYRKWGITDVAWRIIAQKEVNPIRIFCHPRVLSEQPRLLLYYRTVNMISQKGLASLVRGNIAKIEEGKIENVDRDWLHSAVVALNGIASIIIKNSAEIDSGALPGFQFATAGAIIQGSWNNAIGEEGESAVKTILVNHLRDEIDQIVWRDSSTVKYQDLSHTALLDHVSDVRVLRLKQAYHLNFGSEPDVSLRDPKNVPIVAVEVKPSADPAGALERLGAAMKSLENDLSDNPRVKTVYVVRCVTPELQSRINQGGFFDHTFGLSELLVEDKQQRKFANLFLREVLNKEGPQRRK